MTLEMHRKGYLKGCDATHFAQKKIRMTLNELKQGQHARIDSFIGDDNVLQRLMEMGLIEDEEIEVLGFAPLPIPAKQRCSMHWRA